MRASVVVVCRLSSCGARAWLLRSMWDLPGPGIEPVSPVLAGRFLTTMPPRKSQIKVLEEKITITANVKTQMHGFNHRMGGSEEKISELED